MFTGLDIEAPPSVNSLDKEPNRLSNLPESPKSLHYNYNAV